MSKDMHKNFTSGFQKELYLPVPFGIIGHMDFKQGWLKAFRELAWLTQLGISLITPPLLCAAACWWGIGRLGWPAWTMLPALALGLGAAAVSFYNFIGIRRKKASGPTKRTRPLLTTISKTGGRRR